MEKPNKPSVLIIDDDLTMREVLKLILRSGDYPVIGEASNGEDGLKMCSALKPGLVLLDINMPKMDGLLALTKILEISPGTKVMMVSADSTMNKVTEAIKKGASGFIVKPLSQSGVLDRIAACMKKKP